MNPNKSQLQKIMEWIIAGAALIVTAVLFVWFAQQVNIEDGRLAFDWKMIWYGIEDGQLHRGNDIWIPPPWSLVFVLPLGFLSLRVSWGLIMFFTFMALFLSVPQETPRGSYWLALLLIMSSFPSMRNFTDANVEAYVILGTLLITYSYREDKPFLLAFGLLLAAIKPQAVFLLYLAVMIYTLWAKPLPFILKAGLTTLLLALPPTLWGWSHWSSLLLTRTLPKGVSISGTLSFLGFPNAAIIAIQIVVGVITIVIALAGDRELSRYKVGLLVAGSILVTPYVNGLTMIVALAIGVVPLVLEKPILGAALFVLYDLFYINLLMDNRFAGWVSPYSTLILLITWIVLGVMTYQKEIRDQDPEAQNNRYDHDQTPVPASEGKFLQKLPLRSHQQEGSRRACTRNIINQ